MQQFVAFLQSHSNHDEKDSDIFSGVPLATRVTAIVTIATEVSAIVLNQASLGPNWFLFAINCNMQ